ncbi:MAG: glycosyltransferase family 2 protein [Methanobrevibacter sp.]
MIKISIIMPVFNKEKNLKEAINSVLNQTLSDIELICVNDGSTDKSLSILNKYSKKYDFIKIYNQKNQGAAIARNKGMEISKGEYITFLDADDTYIDNNSLEKLYKIAASNNANLVSGNMKIINSKGESKNTKDSKYYKEDSIISPEEYGIPWFFYKNMYKREFLISNNIYFPNLRRGEDPVFLAEVLSELDCIYTVNIDFYGYYYVKDESKWNNPKIIQDYIKQYKYIYNYFENPKFNKIKNDYLYKLFIFIDMLSIENLDIALNTIREVFKGNLLRRFEDYYYLKYSNNKGLMEELNINTEKPRISVIMPIYNSNKYLKEAIDSILNQSFKDFELICVNDGSTDNSPEILENYRKKDKRIKIINQKNQGAASARNTGLKNTKGDYIYFIDSDDYIAKNTLKELYKNAILNDSDIVLYKMAHFNGDKIRYNAPGFNLEKANPNIDFNNYTFNYKKIKPEILNKTFSPCNKFYKKEFLDSYNDFYFDTGIIFEDVPFQVKSLLRAKKISYIPEYFYYYRQNHESVMNTNKNREDIYKIINIVEKFLKDNNYYKEFKYEYDYFKVLQITQYIIPANTEEYFNKAKKELEKIDISKNSIIPKKEIELYNMTINSKSFSEFKREYYKSENKKIENKIKNLENENKKLDNKIKKIKKENEIILNSNIWKITKPLREIKKYIKK